MYKTNLNLPGYKFSFTQIYVPASIGEN